MELIGWGLVGIFILVLGLLIVQRLRGKPVPLIVIVMLAVLTLGVGTVVNFVSRGEDYTAWERLNWQPLAPELIPELVDNGKTVVVSVTAQWCAICRKNDAEVLHRESVVSALEADDIILMQAEMSEPHPIADQYLRHQGALGIPFTKIYTPAYPGGIEMPRELNMRTFMSALSVN